MSDSILTGEIIFSVLVQDPVFRKEIPDDEQLQALWMELCDELPEWLSDILYEEINAQLFLQAKARILERILTHDWIPRVELVYVRLHPEYGTVEDLTESATRSAKLIIYHLSSFASMMSKPIPGIPSGGKIADEVFFEDQDFCGLTAETLDYWRNGGLTLEELLRLQPFALLHNRDPSDHF